MALNAQRSELRIITETLDKLSSGGFYNGSNAVSYGFQKVVINAAYTLRV